MRRYQRHYLRHLIILFSLSQIFIQGCARPALQTYPASGQQIAKTLEAFDRYQEISAAACNCCLDAEADAALSVSGWFSDHTEKVSGFLQAMKPGYLKFIVINPLGQPLFIFLTNGSMFTSLNVLEEKAYSGSVHSETYKKFAPPGFEPEFSYYWLTGRLRPGEIKVQAVKSDREQEKFWLQINHANVSTESMVLFDPVDLVILRHVLRDQQGKHLMDILYAEHQVLPGKESKYAGSVAASIGASDTGIEPCRIPAHITVSSNTDAGRIELRLHSFLAEVRFSGDDFHIEVPDNFEKLLVK